MNGGYNAQVGIAKSFKVYPGDKVKIQAFAKYSGTSGTSSNLSGFATALISAFGVTPPGMGESGTVGSALNSWGGIVAGGGDGQDDGSPHGAVNIIIVDKKFNFLDGTFSQVTAAAEQVGVSPVVAHDFLNAEYTVTEEGYAFLYISNENETLVNVYFDDVKIVYTPGNILQANEYYPFGMQTANSWTRDNVTNNFLANGGTELNRTSQLYDLEFRNYDPALGRMNQVDPMADKYSRHTPYNYSFNSPVMMNDKNGADPTQIGANPTNWTNYGWQSSLGPRSAMDGRGGGGRPDANHPFAGWRSNIELDPELFGYAFGSLTSTPQSDAKKVTDGAMTQDEFVAKYGTKLNSVFFINDDPAKSGLWTADGFTPLKVLLYWIGMENYQNYLKRNAVLLASNRGGIGEYLTQGDGPGGFQDNGILSLQQLKDYFGQSYMEVFHYPLISKINSGTFSTQDVIKYVQDFNYSDIISKTGPYGLFPVEGGRFNVTDPSGISVVNTDLFQGRGTGIHFGYLGKITSGELSGQGLIEFTTSSGYFVQFTLRFEGRIIN